MKKYRPIIIIFVLVVLNVLVTKSEYSREEKIQDAFVTKFATPNFQIKYKMARSFHKLGIKNLEKAHSITVLLTKPIYPHRKQKYYDRSIKNRIYALAAFLGCIKDYCNDVERIELYKPRYTEIIPDVVKSTDIMAQRVRVIAAEVDYLLKKYKKGTAFSKCRKFRQDFNELVTVMSEYEERITALSEKYILPTQG